MFYLQNFKHIKVMNTVLLLFISCSTFAESGLPKIDEGFMRLIGAKKTVRQTHGGKRWEREKEISYDLKNEFPNRDVEVEGPKEYFYRHLEMFETDRDYAAKFPSYAEYFAKRTGAPLEQMTFPTKIMTKEGNLFGQADLNPAYLYQVDYLLASKGDELMSGFGHSMLRFVFCDPFRTTLPDGSVKKGPECLDDHSFHMVVSFRAQIIGLSINTLKGVFGGYPSRLFFIPFNEIKKEYNRDGFRDLEAYKLNITENRMQRLLQRALEMYWTYQGDYKFVSNNCAHETLALTRSALWDAPVDLRDRTTPYGVLDELQDAGVIQEKPEIFLSREADYRRYFQNMMNSSASEFQDLESFLEAPARHRKRVISRTADALLSFNLDTREKISGIASLSLLEKLASEKSENKEQEKLSDMLREGILHQEDLTPIKNFNRLSDNFNLANKDTFGIPSLEDFIPMEEFSARLEEVSKEFEKMKSLATSLSPRLEKELDISKSLLLELEKIKSDLILSTRRNK